MLLGTLVGRLLGNMLTGMEMIATRENRSNIFRAGKGPTKQKTRQSWFRQSRRWSTQSLTGFLIPSYILVLKYKSTQIKWIQIQRCLLMKNWAYLVNLDEYKSIGTQWTVLHANGNIVTYFESFVLNIFQKK